MLTKADDMHTYVVIKKRIILFRQTCECTFQRKWSGFLKKIETGINLTFFSMRTLELVRPLFKSFEF